MSPTPIFNGVEEWLQTRKNSLVEVRTPSRGDLVTLMQLAAQNAEIQLIRFAKKTSGSLEKRSADDGAALLNLSKLDHIVCFDMAQLIGEERVGASVTFREGRPAKDEYRKYIVKGQQMDDLRMMEEVVERWDEKTN